MKIKLLLLIPLFATSLNAQNETKTKSKPKFKKEINVQAVSDSLETIFFKNAKTAQLTPEITRELLQIIDERNVVIAGFVAKRERHNAPFNVQDPWVMYNYKIDEAQKFYAKKIKTLLTYEQYRQFVEVNFKQDAEEKTKEEYFPIIEGNPDLKKEQQEQLYLLIYDYQLNLLITTAYYNYDKNLQKSKQGALTFKFERKFSETCKTFNIKMEKIKSSSAKNFEWN